ncbi:MAG: hypothetical protein HFJ35_03225 [Clostridia bacterium]|nr:hypothetical protein [Clostridia bacterium]
MKERHQIEENIESLKRKIDFISTSEKKEISNQEVKEKTRNFLKAEYINKEILFDIVNRIEIDENKKVFIHFNFEQLNIYGSGVDSNVSIS